VIVGLVALLLAARPAWAQESTPTPKALWEPPLAPGQAPRPAASAAPRRAASDGGGGIPLAVPIGLAVLLAGAGAGVGLGRRRRTPAAPVVPETPPVEAPAPRRFQWREYPTPARPAPPPPPVPGRAPPFEAGLEEERRAPEPRAKQQERR
jgi:hypothetical protein